MRLCINIFLEPTLTSSLPSVFSTNVPVRAGTWRQQERGDEVTRTVLTSFPEDRRARRAPPPANMATSARTSGLDLEPGRTAPRSRRGVAYPRFGVGIAFGEEAPRRAPEVFQNVDQVDDDGNDDPSGARFGLNALDLVVVAVDQRDPAAPMIGVASFGFVEDAGEDLGRVVDHAGGDPLVLGLRCRRRRVLAALGGEYVGGPAGHRCKVVDGTDLGQAFAVAFLALG